MRTKQGRDGIAFAAIHSLTALYAVATVATTGFLVWRREDRTIATDHAWGHALTVLGFAVVLVAVARRAARGSRRALLRLRIISVVIPVVSVVLVAIPGFLPTWMRVEQGIYGVLLSAVAVLSVTGPGPAVARGPRPGGSLTP